MATQLFDYAISTRLGKVGRNFRYVVTCRNVHDKLMPVIGLGVIHRVQIPHF